MPTVIGFSGAKDDFVLVEEDLAAVARLIDNTERMVEVTIVPGYGDSFTAGSGFVNPGRVAYLRAG